MDVGEVWVGHKLLWWGECGCVSILCVGVYLGVCLFCVCVCIWVWGCVCSIWGTYASLCVLTMLWVGWNVYIKSFP